MLCQTSHCSQGSVLSATFAVYHECHSRWWGHYKQWTGSATVSISHQWLATLSCWKAYQSCNLLQCMYMIVQVSWGGFQLSVKSNSHLHLLLYLIGIKNLCYFVTVRTLGPWTLDICLYIFWWLLKNAGSSFWQEYLMVLLLTKFHTGTFNTIHHKKSLYFLVVKIKICTQKYQEFSVSGLEIKKIVRSPFGD